MSAPVIFRPYQEKMIAAWEAAKDRGIQRGLIVAATGTGKTTVFSGMIRAGVQDPSFSALVLAHRIELLDQAARRIEATCPGLMVGVEAGGSEAPQTSQVVVGSVMTLGLPHSTRADWLGPNLVICDEAHHAAAATYQRVFNRFGCYEEDGTYLLGVTATPHRLDNKALVGGIGGHAIFEEIVFRYDIVAAIRDGFLVDLRGYRCRANYSLEGVQVRQGDYVSSQLEKAVNTDPVNEQAYKSWSEIASDRQTIIFCVGVDHALDVAQVFKDHGVKAEAVYGDMPAKERAKALEDFQEGRIQVLTNIDVLTEGFDAQACGAIVLLRPTQSWTLFTQQVGRGLRTLPGIVDGIGEPSTRREAIKNSRKPDCIVIDIVGITEEHKVSDKKNGGGRPSLQELVGLPSQMELEGATLIEAVERFEDLPEIVKSVAFKRPTSFSGLSTVLTQVEMLAELEVPDEAGDASLYWLKTGELQYKVCCDVRSESGSVRRSATLSGDLVGNWTLSLYSSAGRNETYGLGNFASPPFVHAETLIEQHFAGVKRLAGRNAPWRKGIATEPQKAYLVSLGVDPHLVAEISDKGTASAMIDMLRSKQQPPQQRRPMESL